MGTKPKGLPDCVKSYLTGRWKLDKNLVNKATFTRSNPIALNFTAYGSIGGVSGSVNYTYKFSGTGGFTWGNNIDFLDTDFDPSDGIDDLEVGLVGHEFKHVEQYANDPNFTAKYLLNFFANYANDAIFKPLVDIYANGISEGAYKNIDYEKEANTFQKKIAADIKAYGNPCKPYTSNGKKYAQ